MAHDHVKDYDAGYGPTPPDAKHEHTDIDVNVGYRFALWLAVAMVISAAIMYGTFFFFEGRERQTSAMAQKYPLAVGQEMAPPAPNLQVQPFKDVYALRATEADRLSSYGWVDKDGGITHIPIERAMELMVQHGLPLRPEARDALNVVIQDSSSGRTMVPR